MDASMSLASLLANSGCRKLITRDGKQEDIEVLEGKVVGLFFGAARSRACMAFLDRLVPIYEQIKQEQGDKFEIIFLSNDDSFEDYHKILVKMPWLAVPYNDRLAEYNVALTYKIQAIPSLVIVDTDGKTMLTPHGRSLVTRFGTKAFPFKEDHLNKMKDIQASKAANFPSAVIRTELHPHVLNLVFDPFKYHGMYFCQKCNTEGNGWSYYCSDCSFSVHPSCVNESYNLDIVPEASTSEGLAVTSEGLELLDEASAGTPRQRITPRLVNKEAKKLVLGGLASAILVVVMGVVTFCCTRREPTIYEL